MNIIGAVILLGLGLIMLWKSAEILVSGAVGCSKYFGVSSMIIGLTVVAMGTSAPEVAASIAAVIRGSGGDIAIGNIYGSNIANLALVGGLVALIRPILIKKEVLRFQIPTMIIVALLLWPILNDLYLSRAEALLLLAIFAALLMLMIHKAKKQAVLAENDKILNETPEQLATKHNKIRKHILFIIVGLAGLALGAEFSVRGAVVIGDAAGMSKAVIGLTIIALGTSLPELVTSIVAVLKGQFDLSIGNLVGSNIFNTLLVTGIAGSIKPFHISKNLMGVDYWVMVIISVCFMILAAIFKKINRTTAAALFATYIAYVAYLLWIR